VGPLLHHLGEAVGDAQRGVDEALHAAHQARLRPVVQLGARGVHTLVPAHVGEGVDLERGPGVSPREGESTGRPEEGLVLKKV